MTKAPTENFCRQIDLRSRLGPSTLSYMRIKLLAILLTGAAALAVEGNMTEPRFADGNQLVRPENYHDWVFVGSSLGMSYSQGSSSSGDAPDFHNVYIQPETYRQFASSGTFPDGTMLVMEIRSAGSNASINKQGHFEDRLTGLDVAVKSASHFPEKWAYFNFDGPNGTFLSQAKPLPKDHCWSCHNAHGAADNVFVQFYPVLREASKQGASAPSEHH